MLYAEQQKPGMMNQFTIEDIVREEIESTIPNELDKKETNET